MINWIENRYPKKRRTATQRDKERKQKTAKKERRQGKKETQGKRERINKESQIRKITTRHSTEKKESIAAQPEDRQKRQKEKEKVEDMQR